MDKRISRFSRRSLVGVIVGLAFAAAAGVGLAQITSEPSTSTSAVTTTTQSTGTPSTSTPTENDFADDSNEAADPAVTTGTIAPTGQQQAPATTSGAGQEKVDVCHITGNGRSHTINIAEPAVAAHVAHGDTEGACAATTQTPTTTAKTKKPKHVHSTIHVSSSTHGNSSHPAVHVSHSSSAHSSHTSHGNSGHASHGNSGSSHGNGHNK